MFSPTPNPRVTALDPEPRYLAPMVVAGREGRALYPPRAYEDGVGGRAVVECDLRPPKLGDCRVLSEAPLGKGFGASAVAIAETLSVEAQRKPWEVDSVRLPIVFANPNDLVTPLSLDEAVGCYGLFSETGGRIPSRRDLADLNAARTAALKAGASQDLTTSAVEALLSAAKPLDYPANKRCTALR